jgi:MoaA/NifB/PqqE/SkfB family radical SAM enzyme
MAPDELLLDFRITSVCHLGCNLCFRNPDINDSSYGDITKVIAKMYDMGFRRIGFTGGEPTVRPDYLHMIKFAKQLGFLTYLSTVGTSFIKDLPQLENNLDWVGLPIDGITFDVNMQVRSPVMGNQHKTIEKIFNDLSSQPTSVKIKLTTVVSKANIDSLPEIVSYVKALPYDFNAWRFYQFCPLGVGKEKRETLEISTTDFLEKMVGLNSQFNEPKLSWATFEERDMANVVMEPNFDLIIPVGDTYSRLCNMLRDSKEQIMEAVFSRDDILKKCKANRFWVK